MSGAILLGGQLDGQNALALNRRVADYERFAQNCGLSSGGTDGAGTQNPMGTADMVLIDDDHLDGRLHGWRPSHFGGDVSGLPISVETDYPFAGLFLATPDTPYRASARGNQCFAIKGLSARAPVTGILSLSALITVQSMGPDIPSWTAWGMGMDLQNWTDTLRATPAIQCNTASYPSRPQLQVVGDDGNQHNITGLMNPITGSTVSSTQYLFAGENEEKWDVNYLRMSFSLGNLFTAGTPIISGSWTGGTSTIPLSALPPGFPTSGSGKVGGITGTVSWTGVSGTTLTGVTGGSGTVSNAFLTPNLTANYYEANINGWRFDLRSQGFGCGAYITPQTGTAVESFAGGMNFQVQLYRGSLAANGCRMVAGKPRATFHQTGWLV